MNKHTRSDANSNPADLRSDIDHTRQRLDSTIDAIASRLRGRHLVDEALHFVRAKSGDGEMRQKASEVGSKISDSAGTVAHAVADTVKEHPLPTLLIGAGIAWLAYEKKRPEGGRESRFSYPDYDPDYDTRREAGFSAAAMEEGVPAGAGTSLPADYTVGAGESESTFAHLKESASEKAGELRERVRRGAERVGERAHEWRERSSEMRGHLRERAGVTYGRAREGVVGTVERHPLESAIACLAAGVLAGILLPTPRPLDEAVGPTSERVRRRVRDTAREAVERGRYVAQAAASAAREEARAQGLTPEGVRESAASVAGRAREAASETARKEAAAAAGQSAQSAGRLPSPEADERRPSPDDAASSGF